MDVVLEAITLYNTRKAFKPNEILRYTKICRVEKIIQPNLEISIEKNHFRNDNNMLDKHYVCGAYLAKGVLSLKTEDLCDYNF